ncbi:MAG: ABC transporter ATP-binding protein [Synechococcaceae cyanobacterium]|nr:ABC transporter ATP-binding protein [Synechococcaceae cyanobacterium]
MSDLLRLEQLSCRFGGLVAVDSVSLGVRAGEIFGLIGPNGAGKTTLFNLIAGLTPASGGQVLWRGSRINALRPERINRLGLARTFQNIRLFDNLSSRDNVLVGLNHSGREPLLAGLLGRPSHQRHRLAQQQRALELLEQLDLREVADRPAGTLSYGDRRRLEIARALATEPALLLLDEPAAGMNPAEKEELCGLIEGLRRQRQLTILIIEHHVPLMMQLCDRLAVLNFGRLIALGDPDAVRRDPQVIEAYLGGQAEPAAPASGGERR